MKVATAGSPYGRAGRIQDGLLSAGQRAGDRSAVIDGRRETSYRELAERATGFAGRLIANGLAEGDRVAIFLEKTQEAVVALYGVWIAGGIAVPVNPGLKRQQVEHILRAAGCRILVCDVGRRRVAVQATFGDVSVIEVGEERATPQPAADSASDEPAVILYTSGSTGAPKGILLSHANLVAGAEIVAEYLKLVPEDRVLCALPFSFDYGLNQLLSAAQVGATCVLQRSMFPADLCRSLQDHAVSVFAGVPPLWIQLMSGLSPFDEMSFPSLRLLTSSGGVFPVDVIERYRAKLPAAEIVLMYGFSEAFRSTYLPPAELDRRPDSMGRAIPRCEVFVLDEEGRECAAGEVGELVHRGPTVALGYWQDPEATERVFRADPMDPSRVELVAYSGDLVRRDEDGFLYYVGRRDSMLKCMGFRISPEDVERQLLASGLISEAVVHGRPDEVAGMRVVAHVAPIDPDHFRERDLARFCRREMPSYMVPSEIRVYDQLPRTGSGKFDRKGLEA